MKLSTILLLFTIVGLAIQVNSQDSTDTTQTDMVDGEDFLQAITNLANSLNGVTITTTLAAQAIVPALQNLLQYKNDFGKIGNLLQLNTTEGSRIDQTYFQNLSNADTRSFPDADKTFATLFELKGQQQCYEQLFSQSISEIYVGWREFRVQLRGGIPYLSNIEQLQYNYTIFCEQENERLAQKIYDLASLLIGNGQCDGLQTLYDGNVDYNYWKGYQDFIDDKAGYIIMYIFYGIGALSGCNPGQDLSEYSNLFEQAIQRTLEFDQQALQNINDTLPVNLQRLAEANQNLSLAVFAQNVNGFFLSSIYDSYLTVMMVLPSDTPQEDYYAECWDCYITTVGDYLLYVQWVPANSTASLASNALDSIDLTQNYTNEQLAQLMWDTLGNCTSGIGWIKPGTLAYFSDLMEDRVIYRQSDTYQLFAAGIKEDCRGRPPTNNPA